jgi:hypothetical protein
MEWGGKGMPSVLTFWQLPEEEAAFIEYLQTTGNVLALPSRWVKTREELSPQPIRAYLETHDPPQISFGLEQHLKDISPEPRIYEGESGFMQPSEMEFCLIGYNRPRFRRNTELGQSNLAAYWQRLDPEARILVEKPPEFVRWGKAVFAWLRRHTPEWHQKWYRVTQGAMAAKLCGKVEFVF